MIWRIFLMLLVISPIQAKGASFNCEAETSKVEKKICDDRELSALDDQMAVWYRAVRRALLPESEHENQRRWLSERNRCLTSQCLSDIYRSRVSELQNLAAQQFSDAPHDQNSGNEYVVRCTPQKHSLSIHEGYLGPSSKREEASAEYFVRPQDLVELKETERQTLLLPKGKRRFVCHVGKSTYQVAISPHIFNANIQGECGAADPVIEATVIRNGEKLLDRFPFGSCRGATAKAVHRVVVDERSRTIRFLVTLDYTWLPLRIEKSFPLDALPENLDHAIFEAVPTGDVDVDLFIAVRKRDLEGVRTALAKGAWPNARDLQGFTPVSYVWRSGWGREMSLVEQAQEDMVLEQIAEALFRNGATADIHNREGSSLLEYLVGGLAPSRVIELALHNGADPRTDRSLNLAAQWGDAALVKKLLKLGANPNAKQRDRTTALYRAAISGFYTYGPNYPKRPIEAFAACLRLLFESGAKIEDSQPDGSLFVTVTRQFHEDQRARIILAELAPYAKDEDFKSAYSILSQVSAGQKNSQQLKDWLGKYVRP